MEVLNTISFTDCLVEIVIAASELTKDVLSGPWAEFNYDKNKPDIEGAGWRVVSRRIFFQIFESIWRKSLSFCAL
jgi:hypothetical protein